MRTGRFGGVGRGYDAWVTDTPEAPDVPDVADVPEVPEVAATMDANEADILEQASTVDEGLPGAGAAVEGVASRLLEANEADLLEQSLSVPADEDDVA